MEVNNEIMEIVSFEKRTFEEMAAKLDYFVQRMDDLCRQHGEKKAERWMDSHAVCRKLRISPRTLQTADGLFHHLSSCCMAGGQYDPTEQSRHMIITA